MVMEHILLAHQIVRDFHPYENFGNIRYLFDNSENHYNGGWAAYTSSTSSLFNEDYTSSVTTGSIIDNSSASFTFKTPQPILPKAFYHNYDGSNNNQTYKQLKIYGINLNAITSPTHSFNFKTSSTTTINDDFGGLTGTFMNGITSNVSDGLVSDGVDDYVDLGSITYGTSFSIELYVKPGTSMAWDDQFFHAANDINAATDAFWLSRYSTTQVNFFLVTNEGTNKHFTSPNSSDYNHSNSQWVHYVVTVSSNESTGGTVVVYVNNKSYTDIFTGTLETGTRTINAVGSPDTRHSYHRNGEINVKYLRIWSNRVLTSSDVNSLYINRESNPFFGEVITQIGPIVYNDNSNSYKHITYLDTSNQSYDEYKFVYSGTFQEDKPLNITDRNNGASIYDTSDIYYGPNPFLTTLGTNDSSGKFFANSLILHDSSSSTLQVPLKDNKFNTTIWNGKNEMKYIVIDLGEKKKFNTIYVYDNPDLSGLTDVSLSVINNEPYYDLSATNLQYNDSSWNVISEMNVNTYDNSYNASSKFESQYARYIRISAFNDGTNGQKGVMLKKIRITQDNSANYVDPSMIAFDLSNNLDFINYQTSDLSYNDLYANGFDLSLKQPGGVFDSSGLKLTNERVELNSYTNNSVGIWSSTTYSQLGQTLTGNANNDRIFSTMGMSSDGLKLVSANQLDPTTDSRGTIQAYSFNGNAWVTYGSLIEAQASEVGESAYSSIADMTDDGTRIFIGYRQIGSNAPDTKGFAQVYDYVNGDWSQVGNNIQGDNTGDDATRVGKISGDGTTIAHMGGYTDTASTRYCQVRRYVSSTNTWDQIGSNIAVALTNKNTDKTDCLAISQNGNIVAIEVTKTELPVKERSVYINIIVVQIVGRN